MAERLFEIMYMSTASLALANTDLDNILTVAKRDNAAAQITGLLCYNGRNFIQLLEGRRPVLLALMDKITHDNRHSGVAIIRDQPIDNRQFPDWTMELFDLRDERESRDQAMRAMLPPSLQSNIRDLFQNYSTMF